jgi:hypothetical protein
MGTLRNRFLEHLLPSLRSLVEIYYLWLTKLPLYTRLHLKMVIFSLEYCKIDLAMLKFRFSQIAKHDVVQYDSLGGHSKHNFLLSNSRSNQSIF